MKGIAQRLQPNRLAHDTDAFVFRQFGFSRPQQKQRRLQQFFVQAPQLFGVIVNHGSIKNTV